MSCWAIVRLSTGVKASADEVEVAVKAMGLTVTGKCATVIYTGSLTFTNQTDGWSVNASAGSFDTEKFKREVARAKVLAEAKKQGYRVYKDERQGDKIVIRMKVGG